MNTRTKTLGLMTMAALVALPGLSDTVQGQQGPVRQGLRGAAEISGQAVRRTGEATRNVVGGVARGTAETVRRTGQAARNLGQGTRDALRGTTQPYSGRYGAGYRGDVQQGVVYADGQYQGQPGYHQGQYVEGAWHSVESNQSYANSGQVHQLRHDRCGREFICLNGRRVYFTSQARYQQSQSEKADRQNEQNAYESHRQPLLDDQSTNQPQNDHQGVSDEANGAQSSDYQVEASGAQPSDSQTESTPDSGSANPDEVDRTNADDESTDSDS